MFSSVNLGEPTESHGWKLFPMFPTAPPALTMLLARSAVERGLARVAELPSGPSVRALSLVNEAAVPLLVRDGDLFAAGCQDRIADRPMLVPARSTVELPVSCVEQNRWGVRERADFSVCDESADVLLRSMSTARADEAPDQGIIWATVSERRRARGFTDASGSLLETHRGRAEPVDAATRALAPVYGATGLVLCHDTPAGARVAVLECFADTTACADAWTGTVRAALASLPVGARAPRISRTEVRALFDALAAARHPSVAPSEHGTVVGFSHGHTRGRALLHEGRVAHLVTLRA